MSYWPCAISKQKHLVNYYNKRRDEKKKLEDKRREDKRRADENKKKES